MTIKALTNRSIPFAPPVPAPRVPPAAQRQRPDVLELHRRPPPLVPPPPDMGALLEKLQYSRKVSRLTDAELEAEVKAQEERLQEATTGAHTDPEAAADAKWRLEVLKAEQGRRVLVDPSTPVDEYQNQLGELSDAQLDRERKRLEAAIEDASTGPHTNEADVEALEERLALVKSEMAQRVVDDPTSGPLAYWAATRNLTDEALLAEQAQLQGEYDALVEQLKTNPDPKLIKELSELQPRLSTLNREVERRELEPATAAEEPAAETPAEEPAAETPAPVDEPAATEEPAQASDGTGGPTMQSQPYTVQSGDALWLIAQRVSDQHGGTPSQEQVMSDLLALNPLENPDLIHPGQVLQVPVYP